MPDLGILEGLLLPKLAVHLLSAIAKNAEQVGSGTVLSGLATSSWAAVSAHAQLVKQERGNVADQPVQLGFMLGGLGLQQPDAPGGRAHRLDRHPMLDSVGGVDAKPRAAVQ